MEENSNINGLWKRMQGNKVTYDPSKFKLEDLGEMWETARKNDQKRRERMDKEYTDIGKITLEEINKEIEKMGGEENMPKGVFVKVKLAGMYQDMHILILKRFLEAIQKEVDKLKQDERG